MGCLIAIILPLLLYKGVLVQKSEKHSTKVEVTPTGDVQLKVGLLPALVKL